MKKHWKILLVLLVAAVLLTGCKTKAPQEAQEACESFFAAFTSQDEAALAAVLEGADLETALRRGCAASALAVQKEGAAASIPSREEVDRFFCS